MKLRSFKYVSLFIFIVAAIALPQLGFCSVESSLASVQSKLVTTILPLAAILGMVFAGLSFVAGSANARNHLMLAIVGAIVGFGAQSIVAFIRAVIN